jgi:hypothetical protein
LFQSSPSRSVLTYGRESTAVNIITLFKPEKQGINIFWADFKPYAKTQLPNPCLPCPRARWSVNHHQLLYSDSPPPSFINTHHSNLPREACIKVACLVCPLKGENSCSKDVVLQVCQSLGLTKDDAVSRQQLSLFISLSDCWKGESQSWTGGVGFGHIQFLVRGYASKQAWVSWP